MRNSIHDIIYKTIEKADKGSLVFPTDFKGLADEAAINMALSRLNKEGVIKRLAQGIYAVPKYDPLLGLLYPSLEEIAQAIADRDHARIRPTGSYALHKLGLSTQVPMNLVYLTDGAPRKIKIGKGSIKFKKSTPKKLLLKGPISSLVIQALEELPPQEITSEIENKLKELLKHETQENLINDFKLAPAWIRKRLVDYSKLNPYHDRTTPLNRRTT
jgi:hypothetical protein